jgi:hypothetical protein
VDGLTGLGLVDFVILAAVFLVLWSFGLNVVVDVDVVDDKEVDTETPDFVVDEAEVTVDRFPLLALSFIFQSRFFTWGCGSAGFSAGAFDDVDEDDDGFPTLLDSKASFVVAEDSSEGSFGGSKIIEGMCTGLCTGVGMPLQ